MRPFVIVACLLVTINCSGGDVNDPFLSFPTEVEGWRAQGADAAYDRATLYDYMNGGAEMFLTYDFRRVWVRRYEGPDESEITADLYDMGSSEEAFGMFSFGREDEGIEIGQDSEYGADLLRFWKGRYFVSIMGMGDEEAIKSPMVEIGKAIDAAITETGPGPLLLNALPGEGLQRHRITYFHSDIVLSNVFFLASENILHLTNDTNCLYAEYAVDGDNNASLLLIEYETSAQALEGYDSFLAHYIPEGSGTGLAQTESGNWTMANLTDKVLSIVFEAPDEDWASELLSAVSSS